jgi:hypothetical protein
MGDYRANIGTSYVWRRFADSDPADDDVDLALQH